MKRQILLTVFIFLAIFPVAGTSVFAITISEYRSNIETARSIVSEMYNDLDERDVTSSAHFDPAKLKALRELLPADVEITTANGEQAASNQWLHADLDEFVTSDTDIKRLTILGGIYERLTAIQWQLSEYENAGNTDRSKDANKKALAEILEQEQFQKPTGDEKSLIERLIESILRFFAEMFPRSASSGEPIQSSPALARTLQVLIILVVAALVLFVVYKLAPHVFPSLRRRKKQDLDDRVILGEKIDSDRTSHDLMREAELLAQQGDNRAAVRKGYIALLFELSERGVIGLARHKTNRDYLRDVRREDSLFEPMKGLTGIFEHSWYGSRPVSAESWLDFKEGYFAMLKKQRKY